MPSTLKLVVIYGKPLFHTLFFIFITCFADDDMMLYHYYYLGILYDNAAGCVSSV